MTDAPDRVDLPPPVVAPPIERVVAGVAADLACRLGLDPLWLRLAFVAMTLFGGLGVVVYVGLWFMLRDRLLAGWPVFRLLGAAVLLVGGGAVLENGAFLDQPLALAAGLAGLALALWQPRVALPHPASTPPATSPSVVAGPSDDGAATRDVGADGPPDRTRRDPLRRAMAWRRPRRQPSVLGRLALGVALIAAAVGALIDEANGGRLHPEQWLGIAAAVCGLGAVVGAWRGRALWLVVPGLLFAGGGYVAGHAARAGVETWRWGDAWYWVDRHGMIVPGPGDPGRVSGDVFLSVGGVPADARPVELVVGIGDVDVLVDRDVTLRVNARLHDGSVRLDGATQPIVDGRATLLLGPEGPADVTVDVEISRGDISIRQEDIPEIVQEVGEPPVTTMPVEVVETLGSGVVDIGEGLLMGSDGTVVLPLVTDGSWAAVISSDGAIRSSHPVELRDDGVSAVPSGRRNRPYLVLPNQMVITPAGVLVDVPAARATLPDDGGVPVSTITPGSVPVTTTIDGG